LPFAGIEEHRSTVESEWQAFVGRRTHIAKRQGDFPQAFLKSFPTGPGSFVDRG